MSKSALARAKVISRPHQAEALRLESLDQEPSDVCALERAGVSTYENAAAFVAAQRDPWYTMPEQFSMEDKDNWS